MMLKFLKNVKNMSLHGNIKKTEFLGKLNFNGYVRNT